MDSHTVLNEFHKSSGDEQAQENPEITNTWDVRKRGAEAGRLGVMVPGQGHGVQSSHGKNLN